MGTNFNRKATKAIGALGVNSLHLDFFETVNSDAVIEVLDKLRAGGKKIFVILDNASPHKSKKIKDYVGQTRGDVVLWYLPPYTPQHNPIEIVWREIKRAIAGRYFGKFDKMHETIRRLIKSGEVATVKLFKYLLTAIKAGRDKTLPVLAATAA